MKKQILLFVTFLIVIAVSAQTEKGSKLVSVGIGGFSYSHSDNTTSYSNTPTVYNSTSNSFNVYINPTVAWFLMDNLAVGGNINFGYYSSKSKSSNTGSTTTNDNNYNSPSIYIGPFARYYFGTGSKGKIFAQVNVSYGFYPSKSKYSQSTGGSSETTTKSKGNYSFGPTFGYEHFISDYLGMYVSLGYSYNHSKYTNDYVPSTGTGYTYTSNQKYSSIPLSVGLQVHLPKKGKK